MVEPAQQDPNDKHQNRQRTDNIVLVVACSCFAIPLCGVGVSGLMAVPLDWHKIVHGFGLGLPAALVGTTFFWWRDRLSQLRQQAIFGDAAFRWLPLGLILCAYFFVGPIVIVKARQLSTAHALKTNASTPLGAFRSAPQQGVGISASDTQPNLAAEVKKNSDLALEINELEDKLTSSLLQRGVAIHERDQAREVTRKVARWALLKDMVKSLQPAPNSYKEQARQALAGIAECPSAPKAQTKAQQERCSDLPSDRSNYPDINNYTSNLDLQSVMGQTIIPSDTCGRSLNELYPEEDSIDAGEAYKQAYRQRKANYSCMEQRLSEILDNAEREIAADHPYVVQYGGFTPGE